MTRGVTLGYYQKHRITSDERGQVSPLTPEGKLIRRARELAIPKLTIRAAAARIGISAEQWGYVERGYIPTRRGEQQRPFTPTAVNLAKMAASVGVTPRQLSEIGRADAAAILEDIPRKEALAPAAPPSYEAAPLPFAPAPAAPSPDAGTTATLIRAFEAAVWAEVDRAATSLGVAPAKLRTGEADVPASEVFTDDLERMVWGLDYQRPAQRVAEVAALRAVRAQAAGNSGSARTGLPHRSVRAVSMH
jgi:hypothetical protein